MKKIFGISLVAVFAAMPMMARAADVPTPFREATGNALTTQSYVKGAYNDLAGYINQKQDKITADNKLPASLVDGVASDSAVSSLASRVGDLETTVGDAESGLVAGVAANSAAISALEDTVNDADTGLATKASQAALNSVADDVATNSTAIASNAEAIASNAEAIASNAEAIASNAEAIASNAEAIASNASDIDALQTAVSAIETASSNYASKTGVTNTISASSASTPVSVVSDWGTDSATTVNYSGTLTGASYTETAASSSEEPEQAGGE